jgi:hypothetical protein
MDYDLATFAFFTLFPLCVGAIIGGLLFLKNRHKL